MNLEIKGTIKTIGETIEGGKGDKTWQKMFYTIDTGEQYDNIISFEIFSADKIEQFRKYNVLGDKVTVHFNIKCREWEGKYFTNLSSWRCVKDVAETTEAPQPIEEGEDDLPF